MGNLQIKANAVVHRVYDLTGKFPKEELYCVVSQTRRAALSVAANIIEGYARQRSKVFVNHLQIAYGSLMETKYFLYFSCQRCYITKKEYLEIWNDIEEVAKILWTIISKAKADN